LTAVLTTSSKGTSEALGAVGQGDFHALLGKRLD